MRVPIFPAIRTTAAIFTVSLLTASAFANGKVKIVASFTGDAPNAIANASVQSDFDKLGSYFQSRDNNDFTLTASITWQSSADIGGSNVLGAATSGSFEVGSNNIAYGQPLYRYLGNAFNGTTPDLDVYLNNQFGWDYTQSTPSNGGNYSLASVLYHEGFHALGFLSDFDVNGNYEQLDDNLSAIYPTIFSTLVENAAGQRLVNLTPAQRALALSGNTTGLFFGGANATTANGGNRVQLYAPGSFQDGSSGGSHTDQNQNYAPLMRPAIDSGVYITPSNIELAMMQDIGWQTAQASVLPETSSVLLFAVGGMALIGVVRIRRTKSAA